MKILIVNKFLYPKGGSETYIFKLGDFLKSLNHEVQYFGMNNKGNIVGNCVNAYTSEMDFHGGTKLYYSIKTIYSYEARKKIRIILDAFQPDVVHLNNFSYQITPSIILEIVNWRNESQHCCSIIFTAHDYNLICPNHMLNNPNTRLNCEKCLGGHFFNCIKGKCIHGSIVKSLVGTVEAYYWKQRKTYKYINTVICCSQFMKSKMDTNPLFAGKTIKLYNFIDKVEWRNVVKKNYIIYFGRLSEEKGVGTLIDVCKLLPNIRFVFAGAGPLEDKMEGVANITYVGFKTGKELEMLIREAMFSIYPSEWYENCPFSVMESQMYGTPVLGADIGGIPELILPGKTGELFKHGDKLDLKSKIESLWNDMKKLAEYSQNCRNIQFDDIEQYSAKIIKIYSRNT